MKVFNKRICVEPGRDGLLRRLNLDDYDSVMGISEGRLVAQNKGKLIRVIQEESGHGPKRYFLKMLTRQRYTDILKSVLKPKPMRIITSRERHLLKFLKEQGIPVMETAAWGTKEIFGIPVGGFLIVEEVKGKDFVEVYRDADRSTRNRMMEGYGRLVGHMHTRGLDSLVRVTDIVCVSEELKDFRKSMVLIDREWGSLKKRNFSLDDRCYQLGKMFVKMVRFIGLPEPEDILHFMKGYKKESLGYHHPVKEILAKSKKYASQLIKGKYREQDICEAVQA
jgi:tRNA A-37 threonylcarbamoyl transferase component Bud32